MPPADQASPPEIPGDLTHRLLADCERCCGLCCVAAAFSVSPEFAIEKEAGEPCPNLDECFRCRIHDRLRVEGFAGCVAYDCHGAGQQVTQGLFDGADWRSRPELASEMFAAFMVMRRLHELLMYLNEALKLEPARELFPEIERKLAEVDALTRLEAGKLDGIDVSALKQDVNELLLRVGERVRGSSKT